MKPTMSVSAVMHDVAGRIDGLENLSDDMLALLMSYVLHSGVPGSCGLRDIASFGSTCRSSVCAITAADPELRGEG
jgi:hypothetical protein